ncbi:hypothetical protein Bbelb_402000 [Branchiostoma belcheri]|nr:hypothetical protein Bbelb_402000 [Branchiostoma belcheri]
MVSPRDIPGERPATDACWGLTMAGESSAREWRVRPGPNHCLLNEPSKYGSEKSTFVITTRRTDFDFTSRDGRIPDHIRSLSCFSVIYFTNENMLCGHAMLAKPGVTPHATFCDPTLLTIKVTERVGNSMTFRHEADDTVKSARAGPGVSAGPPAARPGPLCRSLPLQQGGRRAHRAGRDSLTDVQRRSSPPRQQIAIIPECYGRESDYYCRGLYVPTTLPRFDRVCPPVRDLKPFGRPIVSTRTFKIQRRAAFIELSLKPRVGRS